MRIDPWSSQQSTDYARLRDEFGIGSFDEYAERLPEPPRLARRGIIFGHRGFEPVMRAIEGDEPWGVLTGLMPSGPMHLGHKLVLDQVLYYQSLGADVTITVADIEAHVTRNMSLEKAREIALENYVSNYLALGLDPDRAQVYFQSQRESVKDLSWKLGKHVNFSTMQAIYGFGGETNMGHMVAPLVQVGDILHVQLPEHGGPRPVVVPVGVDQDPHIRLTRDLAGASRWYSVKLHEHPKHGPLVGVFVKPDENVGRLLASAKGKLEAAGYADFEMNEGYKALYVKGAGAGDLLSIDTLLARQESKKGGYGFLPPAATYHRFMQGLTGGKMSSSKPETHISLLEDAKSAEKKIAGAQTGGRTSADEQRKLGGEPEKCMVYETYVYHLVDDDKELNEIYDRCKSGSMLCGECKGIAREKVRLLWKEHADKRDETEHRVKDIVRES